MALQHHLPREDGPVDEYGDPMYTPFEARAAERAAVEAWRRQVERRSRATIVAPLPEDHPAKGFCE